MSGLMDVVEPWVSLVSVTCRESSQEGDLVSTPAKQYCCNFQYCRAYTSYQEAILSG